MSPHDPAESAPADQPGDDFRKIAGIGAALERRLHDAGILTYRDLAACSPEQVAARLGEVAGLSPARIATQDWIGQARQLAGPVGSSPQSEPSQRYASFHIELLLDVDNSVRRTKVHHHQSDTDDAWPGWEEDRLLAFLRDHIPRVVPQRLAEVESVSPAISLTSATLRIEELVLTREGQRSEIWAPGEPTSIRFTLRVNRTSTVQAASVEFTANVAAASMLGDDQRWSQGTINGTIRVDEPLSVELTGQPLPRGLYRLEVTALVYPISHTPDSQPLGGGRGSGALIQVADAPV